MVQGVDVLVEVTILSKNVAKFKGFGTTPTDQNCMHEEIKNRLNLENALCHSVQSLLSFSVTSKNKN